MIVDLFTSLTAVRRKPEMADLGNVGETPSTPLPLHLLPVAILHETLVHPLPRLRVHSVHHVHPDPERLGNRHAGDLARINSWCAELSQRSHEHSAAGKVRLHESRASVILRHVRLFGVFFKDVVVEHAFRDELTDLGNASSAQPTFFDSVGSVHPGLRPSTDCSVHAAATVVAS